MSEVVYREVVGFPGYRVGDDGSVWSRWVRGAGRLGEVWLLVKLIVNNKSNYLQVGLHRDGKQTPRRVHRLVLEVFVGPRPVGMVCRHLDGDPTNNRLSNLCWGTQKENLADAVCHGTLPHGESHCKAKLTEENVRAIRAAAASGESHASIANRYPVNPNTVNRIIHGKRWRHVV